MDTLTAHSTPGSVPNSGSAKGIAAAIITFVAALFSAVYLLAFDETIAVEGGYSAHIDDPGGRTMYGVTETVARRHGFRGDMRALTKDDARAIYYADYWQPQRLDEVADRYPELARQLFDVGVNLGIGRSGAYLQRCLNSLNLRGTYYADVAVDGRVGPATLRALSGYHAQRGARGEGALMTCVAGLQTHHYITLGEASERFESFTYGWLRRVRRKLVE